MTKSRSLSALLLAAGLVLAAPARAAFDSYLKIDGIDGEAKDPNHMGWMEVDSFQFDALRRASVGGASENARAGNVTFHEITLTKRFDKASPKLAEALSNGKPFRNATIEVRKAGEHPMEYLRITLENVLISSYQAGRPSSGDATPTETLTLNFTKIEYAYTPQKTGRGVQNVALASAAAAVALAPTPVPPPKITGASAAAPFMGLAVTVTVTSTGPCENAFVDYGEGPYAERYQLTGPSTVLPTHTYATAGAKTIKVGGSDTPTGIRFPLHGPGPKSKFAPCTSWAPDVHVTLRSAATVKPANAVQVRP